ncbi:MAG: hypothetical protein RR623_07330 [Bacilli bacterium]
MKNKLLFLVVLSLIIIPVKANYNTETRHTILNDGTVGFNVTMTVSNDILEKYNITRDDVMDLETYQISLSNKGYEVGDTSTSIGAGISLSKSFGDISNISQKKEFKLDLSDISTDEFNDSIFFQKKIGLLYNSYIAKFIFDYKNIEELKDEDIKSLVSANYVVVLPNIAFKTDADFKSKDKLTYTWNLEIGKLNEVNYQFKVLNMTNLIIISSIGIIVFIFIAYLLVKVLSKKSDELEEAKHQRKQKKEKTLKEDNNQIINNTNNESIQNKQIINEQPFTQPNQTFVNNQINTPTPNNTINSQPVNGPSENNQGYRTEPSNNSTNISPDYTNIFNQTFDNDKKDLK